MVRLRFALPAPMMLPSAIMVKEKPDILFAVFSQEKFLSALDRVRIAEFSVSNLHWDYRLVIWQVF